MPNLSAPILDLAGSPMLDEQGSDGPVVATVAKACVTALTATLPGEGQLSGEEKFKRFLLAQRIVGTPDLDLAAEDIVLLKRLIGTAYPPLVVGRVWEVLDPASAKA